MRPHEFSVGAIGRDLRRPALLDQASATPSGSARRVPATTNGPLAPAPRHRRVTSLGARGAKSPPSVMRWSGAAARQKNKDSRLRPSPPPPLGPRVYFARTPSAVRAQI